jgi:glycosyltransferase involved in cell wall biosynthesis
VSGPLAGSIEDLREMSTSANRRPKVCHIAATTEGAVWVFEQLRDLRDRYGYDVSAILNGDQGTLVEQFRSAGIPVFSSNFDFTANAELLELPRKVISLVRILRRERFDIIQTHLFHSMVIGRIAAWFADVPIRFSMIAGPFHLEAYTPRWIDKYTCWIDTTTIASCGFTQTLYRRMGVPQDRTAVVYYGPDERKFDPSTTVPADLRAELGWASDTPLVGLVAYFYAQLPRSLWIPASVHGHSVKSQEDLIRAAPLVLREFPQTKFLLIGSGWEDGGRDYRARMQKLVVELGLERDVIFTGFRTDIPAVLRSIDVAVQCSLSENLGGTIESLLMECPTVATRVGGMTDSVLDRETGFLVDPADPKSLADGILRALRDPASARRYAVSGRERMLAGFTLRHTVDDLDALYQRKLAARKTGYRPRVLVARLVLGSIMCSLIVVRYCLLDAWILPRWDLGWRPWRANALSLFAGKMWLSRAYAFAGRHSIGLGIGRRVGSFLGRPFPAPRPLPMRMRLYQLYALIGRHPPNFGIRRQIREWSRTVTGWVLRRD